MGDLTKTASFAGLIEQVLAPGMSAAVEVKTGKRSVISYLLSPVAKTVAEAGRER